MADRYTVRKQWVVKGGYYDEGVAFTDESSAIKFAFDLNKAYSEGQETGKEQGIAEGRKLEKESISDFRA